MTTTDLTKGVYRRIYAGAIKGERINKVSERAELLFWRLHMIADDYGNFDADPKLLRQLLYPLRKITPTQIESMLQELMATAIPAKKKPALIRLYEIDGNWYGHIEGFEAVQPSNRSGRKVRRVPSPAPAREVRGNPGKSGGIQKQDAQSGGSESDSHTHSDSDTHPPPKSGVGSGMRLLWNQASPIYEVYPRHRRGAKGPFTDALGGPWAELLARGEKNPGAVLLDRVTRYAGSWVATKDNGRACLGAARFFGEGVWDQEPQDWDEPAIVGKTGPSLDDLAAAARESA